MRIADRYTLSHGVTGARCLFNLIIFRLESAGRLEYQGRRKNHQGNFPIIVQTTHLNVTTVHQLTATITNPPVQTISVSRLLDQIIVQSAILDSFQIFSLTIKEDG
jgi:hypothetical protein